MQYGESRKTLVVEKDFVEIVKEEFEIDEEIIVQKFDNFFIIIFLTFFKIRTSKQHRAKSVKP